MPLLAPVHLRARSVYQYLPEYEYEAPPAVSTVNVVASPLVRAVVKRSRRVLLPLAKLYRIVNRSTPPQVTSCNQVSVGPGQQSPQKRALSAVLIAP